MSSVSYQTGKLASDQAIIQVASRDESNDAEVGNQEIRSFDPAIEKRLVRKLDIRLMPLLSLMYLFNSVRTS